MGWFKETRISEKLEVVQMHQNFILVLRFLTSWAALYLLHTKTETHASIKVYRFLAIYFKWRGSLTSSLPETLFGDKFTWI